MFEELCRRSRTGKFKASQEAGFKPGWDIDAFKIEGWDVSRLPVCNVYFAGGTVRVNFEAYRNRQEQIANFIARSIPADIIAFQEVSGEQSVREVLPNGGSDYDFCPVTGYKVQRLVIAWKKRWAKRSPVPSKRRLAFPPTPMTSGRALVLRSRSRSMESCFASWMSTSSRAACRHSTVEIWREAVITA
ncbi:hypothetical protein [Rhizobium phaseoli]|uniref:hypothetical protein n=1 Tax=Rhizobium phaseoli TaxID=396 RepID=UPI001FDEC970|nr:hypothetical protein [Rhizobium phaseoli]